ncbi:MAG: pitrilysin family protein [Legionellales bacterium]|nr:pitrilysin family protein [Legionellales bacterium]
MRVIIMTFFALMSCQLFGEVKQFTLDNGLKILVKEDHRAPVVVTMIWYNVGSADEPGGITGASHALEHLMFKGTKKYPLGVFSKTIAALGGQANAFTSNDYTAYYEKLAAPHLAKSFDLEADRMNHLLFDKKEFAHEMKVIQEERRLRVDDNPQARTLERFLATAHLTAPYNHPVIGWMSDIQQMSVADAKAWYQHFYAPNNATLVVVGDVKAQNVHALANHYFGQKKKSPQTARHLQKEPPHLGQKTVDVHTFAQLPMVILGYLVPTASTAAGLDANDPYALEIIASLLDAGESARFTSQLVRGKHLAANVDVYYNLYARYQTQFMMYGSPSQNHTTNDLKQGILDEIKRLQTVKVEEKELKRVKTQILAQKTFERDSIFAQAMELGLLETVGLGWQTSEKYVDRINQVTALQIQNAAIRYFQNKNLTEALLIPDNAHLGDHK